MEVLRNLPSGLDIHSLLIVVRKTRSHTQRDDLDQQSAWFATILSVHQQRRTNEADRHFMLPLRLRYFRVPSSENNSKGRFKSPKFVWDLVRMHYFPNLLSPPTM